MTKLSDLTKAPVLPLLSTVTASAALSAGSMQPVNATSGPVTMTALPALSGLPVGSTYYGVRKTDSSLNAVTVPFTAGDSTLTGLSQIQLLSPGAITLTVAANPAGGKVWEATSHVRSDTAPDARNATLYDGAAPSAQISLPGRGWADWLQGAWFTEVNAGSARKPSFMHFGHSIPMGFNATSPLTGGYPWQVRNLLAAKLGSNSDAFHSWSANPKSGSIGTTPFSNSQSAGIASYEMGYGRCINVQAGTTLTFDTSNIADSTMRTQVSSFDIITLDFATGVWSWSLDGATATQVSVTGPGQAAAVPRRTTVTTTPGSNHTIALTNVSGSANTLQVLAVVANYNTTTGLRHVTIANSSGKAIDWTTLPGSTGGPSADMQGSSSAPFDKIAQLAGNTATSYPINTSFGWPMQPHAATIMLTINDVGEPLHVWESAMERIVQAFHRGRAGANVALLADPYPGMYSDGGLATTSGANAKRYLRSLYTLAMDYGCAFVNLDQIGGETPVASGQQPVAGNIHPGDTWHTSTAATLAALYGLGKVF